MKKISENFIQARRTFGSIIKDARTWLLCLALTALSIIPAAFPAITYANHVTAEWISDTATAVYNMDNGISRFIGYLDLNFTKIVEVYMDSLKLYLPVFITAAASAVILTFCIMAVLQAKEKD